jgi:methionyl-tRNA synthetase
MEEREAMLDPRHFNLAGSVDQIEAWLTIEPNAGEGASAAYWWLKGLSLLAYPLMPKLGSALWSALGQPRTPSMAEFGATTEPTAHIEIPRFTSLAAADLAPCLPETLIRDPLASRRS